MITPYRVQRVLIRAKLRAAGFNVPCTTVHKAQGSERKVVIFDPVIGYGTFLNSEEGFRLINVAFSRAQGKLIVLLSQGDSVNPNLARIFPGVPGHQLFCKLPERNGVALNGLTFGYQGGTYRCTNHENRRLTLHDDQGRIRHLNLDLMEDLCGDPSRCPRGCKPHLTQASRCI